MPNNSIRPRKATSQYVPTNHAVDLYEHKIRPTFRQCCVLAGASEAAAYKEKRRRQGGNGAAKPRKPPITSVDQALAVLRQAALEQRIEAARELGADALWAALEALERRNGSADATVAYSTDDLNPEF